MTQHSVVYIPVDINFKTPWKSGEVTCMTDRSTFWRFYFDHDRQEFTPTVDTSGFGKELKPTHWFSEEKYMVVADREELKAMFAVAYSCGESTPGLDSWHVGDTHLEELGIKQFT